MSVQDEKIAVGGEGSTMDVLCYEIKQLKWRVLAIACFLTFGSYYIYDFPGSLGTARTNSIEALFESKHKKYSQGDNLLLYSVYSWPNVVLAFFGGILIDNVLGLRKAMLLFTTLVAVGAAIFYFGVISTNLPVMVFGRFIFGLGGESLSVAQSAFVARWFRGVRGMALAFGITISFSRVGSSFNFDFSPKIAEKWNVQAAVLAGVFACAISLLSCIVLMTVDVYGERKGIVPAEEIKAVEGVEGSGCVDRAVSWVAALKRDLLKLGAKFWLICAICVTIYCAVFPLIGIAANFFEVKYDVSHNDATTYVSYYQFTCAGASPIIGGVVDRVGRFTLFMIMAGSGFTLVHLLFLVAKPTPFAMMMGMGVVYSFLASSLWPAVPYVVEANSVGIAYGIMTAMQNAGLAVYPLASGAILDSFTPPKPFCNTTVPDNNCSDVEAPLPHLQGYKDTEALFMVTAAFGVVLGVVLMIVDRAGNGVLSSSASDRTRILEEEKSLLDTTESESSIVNA